MAVFAVTAQSVIEDVVCLIPDAKAENILSFHDRQGLLHRCVHPHQWK